MLRNTKALLSLSLSLPIKINLKHDFFKKQKQCFTLLFIFSSNAICEQFISFVVFFLSPLMISLYFRLFSFHSFFLSSIRIELLPGFDRQFQTTFSFFSTTFNPCLFLSLFAWDLFSSNIYLFCHLTIH